MPSAAVDAADRLLGEGFAALLAARGGQAGNDDVVDVARVANRYQRCAEQHLAATVADLDRRGVFIDIGLRPVTAVTQLLAACGTSR